MTTSDSDAEALDDVRDERTNRIRELNDAFRADAGLIGVRLANGQLVITRGVAAHGNAFVDRAVQAVRDFSDFTQENDP